MYNQSDRFYLCSVVFRHMIKGEQFRVWFGVNGNGGGCGHTDTAAAASGGYWFSIIIRTNRTDPDEHCDTLTISKRGTKKW